jgi:PBSX family phage terminase large subunit
MIQYAPFCEKQANYIRRCFACWLNIAEGGKRAGKNIINLIAWANVIENHPDKLHLAAGVSVAAAKLNIIDSNGFGLKFWFAGRCREGEYQKRDALYIYTLKGEEKIILISGGGKVGDEKLIKGNSYGTVYITEANECAKAFIQEVFDRTIASSERKIFFDLNPKPPLHWFYKEILDVHQANAAKYGAEYRFNYEHFILTDNLSLSDDIIRSVVQTYDINSIWYKRDIRGQRTAAEGVIYDMFDASRHIITDPEHIREIIDKATYWYVSNDYGTGTVFTLGLFCVYGAKKYLVRSFYWDAKEEGKQKADSDYVADLKELLGFIAPRQVQLIIIPDDALSFINECVKPEYELSAAIWVYHREPGTVLQGIRNQANMLARNEYFILDDPSNQPVIEEYASYVWDPKAALRGEDAPLKQQDHGKDMERYFLATMAAMEEEGSLPDVVVHHEPVEISPV